MLGFLGAGIGVAYHVVVSLALFLTPLPGGLATAAAIVVFTVAVRLLLSPLSYHAYRGQATMSARSQGAELRTRYASQPDRLQRELTALYRAEGGGLLAGCLPLLLQLPFFSIMYRLFLSRTVGGHPNWLLSRDLLATPLGSHWLTGVGPASAHGLVFLGLFALLAGVGFPGRARHQVARKSWHSRRGGRGRHRSSQHRRSRHCGQQQALWLALARSPGWPPSARSSPTRRWSSLRSCRWPPVIYLRHHDRLDDGRARLRGLTGGLGHQGLHGELRRRHPDRGGARDDGRMRLSAPATACNERAPEWRIVRPAHTAGTGRPARVRARPPHALAGRDEGEHGGEVVGVVPDRGVNPATWQSRTAIRWHSVPGLPTIHGSHRLARPDRCTHRADADRPAGPEREARYIGSASSGCVTRAGSGSAGT